MAVSYKSYIHQPGNYISPVDLNLMGRVLQYKQAQFDAGVAKQQSNIDNIAALDMVKDVDIQYRNAKLNSLVETINNIGGVDYSDPNVQNQIAGLSSQIYGDEHIINAVANTRKFRYVQNYYKDLKEKKPKEWNQANEWYDMNKFSSWLQDGQVGTSAEAGAGQVTPYHDYQGDWQKIFDKIANSANMSVRWTDKGLMYIKDGKKEVSPERIWATASALLSPQQRLQLGIEGRYQYQNVPLSELTRVYDQKLYNQVAEAQGDLASYKAKLKGATSLKDQEDYQKLINEKQAEIAKLTAPIQRSADQIKEKLYLDEKLRGLQARYAFTQVTSTMQAASDKMFKLKYDMDKAKFSYQQQKDTIEHMIDIADKGLMWYTDRFGNKTLIENPASRRNRTTGSRSSTSGYPGGFDDFSGLPTLDNSLEEQKKQFSKESLDARKTTLVNENKELFHKFVTDLGRKMGLSDVLITDLADDGHLQAKVSPEIEATAKNMMDSWNAMTRGEKINYDNLDPLFKDFAGKHQENQKEIEAIDQYYSTIDKQIREKYGITPEAYDAFNDYSQLLTKINNSTSIRERQVLEKQFSEKYGIGKTLPFNGRAMQEYAKNRKEEISKLFEASSTRFNLPALTITDDKNKNLAKMLATNSGTLEWYDEGGIPQGKATLNPDNIEVMSKGYSYLKVGEGRKPEPVITIKYKTGSKANEFEIRKIPLSPSQSLMLGFGTDIKDLTGYKLGLHLNGEVKDVNTTSGKNYDLKYDIVKYNVSDINDPSVFVRVKKDGSIISLYNKPFPSYEQAIQFMEGATKQSSIEEAYKLLDELAK
jgi:hypothetical protein